MHQLRIYIGYKVLGRRKRRTHTRAHVHGTRRFLTGGRHASVNVNASEIRISPLQYNLHYDKYFLKLDVEYPYDEFVNDRRSTLRCSMIYCAIYFV